MSQLAPQVYHHPGAVTGKNPAMSSLQVNRNERYTSKALIVNAGLDQFGNIVGYVKSESSNKRYAFAVQPGTERCLCECPDFVHRCEKYHPTLSSTHICKHLRAGRGELIKMARGSK